MEREVEREVKDEPSRPKPSLTSSLVAPKAKESKPKLTGLKANRGKEAKGMEEVDAEEEDEKKAKKAKGKGKAAPAKVVTGAGSIMGFFSKK